MKIIFLDVDGVLNCASTKERICGFIGVEQEKIALIKKIVDETQAKIVLSSSWRLDYFWSQRGHDTDLTQYNYLLSELRKQGLDIFDVTPYHALDGRGAEIKIWLDEHKGKVGSYAIIDDDIYDITQHKGHVVKTSWKEGIKPGAAKMAINILNK